METGLYFVVLFLACLVASGFFSGLETALTTLSTARTKKLIDDKPIYYRALGLWLKNPNQVLTAILVGNNIAHTLAASTATVLAHRMFDNYAISIATFLVTLIMVVFGEITPKTFARHNAETLAPAGMLILLPIYVLLLPITLSLSFLAARLVSLFGGQSKSQGHFATEEEIAYMIRLSREEGVLKRGEGQMLESVIDFRDTVVKESMIPRMEIRSFDINATYQDVVGSVGKEGHTRWPVYEGNIDNIVGIFHAKDLIRVFSTKDETSFKLSDFLRPVKFVPDMMKIGSLLKEFQGGKAHLAVVVDEYGGTAGIISLEDVLEEIVGEIRDEYDDEERELMQIDGNNFVAAGRANLFEIGKSLDIAFPQSDAFDSLGGFLTAIHGRMPKVGAKIKFEDLTFLVKAADEKKVIQVHIVRSPDPIKPNSSASNFEELSAA